MERTPEQAIVWLKAFEQAREWFFHPSYAGEPVNPKKTAQMADYLYETAMGEKP